VRGLLDLDFDLLFDFDFDAADLDFMSFAVSLDQRYTPLAAILLLYILPSFPCLNFPRHPGWLAGHAGEGRVAYFFKCEKSGQDGIFVVLHISSRFFSYINVRKACISTCTLVFLSHLLKPSVLTGISSPVKIGLFSETFGFFFVNEKFLKK
jgi:hypothetical protein